MYYKRNEWKMDYKKLYHKMFNATSDAIAILQKAQVQCEEMYLELSERAMKIFRNLPQWKTKIPKNKKEKDHERFKSRNEIIS